MSEAPPERRVVEFGANVAPPTCAHPRMMLVVLAAPEGEMQNAVPLLDAVVWHDCLALQHERLPPLALHAIEGGTQPLHEPEPSRGDAGGSGLK